ncbi:hypothetical protein QJS10_CPA06g00458 [Acorus calamus]|uniref:Uncharacterized protein n=1 Tax=Acorus calamus TaxID=4465 RepID=A0AAV9ELI3_ACOCL|nr:hypothetical protein QJS10_CPA06g00458 [Acorus calamus]
MNLPPSPLPTTTTGSISPTLLPPPHHIPHHDRPFDGPFPPTTVHHVAHETPFYPPPPPPHPDIPRVVLPNGPDVRIFCRADSDLSLTVRDGSVVLAPANHRDPFQHWIKDEKFATRVKDREGFPSFALVNKATGLALQHPIGETQPVRLIPYSAGEFNQTILWTLSKDIKHGFKAIRMASNVRLSLDAFHGDKDHGGVRDGTTIVLWECWKGDNQLWKLVPY